LFNKYVSPRKNKRGDISNGATGLAESGAPDPTMDLKAGNVMVSPHWHVSLPIIQTWL